MIPPPALDPAPAVLTAAQERDVARLIRAGRRARLLAQRHLAVRLRRDLPPAVSARAAAAAVLAALLPRLPLAPAALPAVVGPLLPQVLAADARARLLADLAAWPLDQEALRAGDAARAAFVAANERLVVAVARRYQHRGLPLDDLVQEGTVGLLRAVDLFDPARGYKFSTYAVWWITQALRRALAQQVPLAHVPDNVQMERARLARRAHALHAELGHPPSPAALAAATGLPRARVDALTAPLPAPVPLDQIMGDGESTTLGDLLHDPDALRTDVAARAAFVAANHGLVRTVAARYQQRGLPLDDLVQEGAVGLLRAVDLFDPARGYKFSTYAVWWIKQALRRALATQVPLTHVPVNVQDERARLARQAHALHAELGHPPSPADLAAATGLLCWLFSSSVQQYCTCRCTDELNSQHSPLHSSPTQSTPPCGTISVQRY